MDIIRAAPDGIAMAEIFNCAAAALAFINPRYFCRVRCRVVVAVRYMSGKTRLSREIMQLNITNVGNF